MNTCVNCEKTEDQTPLLALRYQGTDKYICAQCLPILIHKPASLSAKLPGVENLPPPQHEH